MPTATLVSFKPHRPPILDDRLLEALPVAVYVCDLDGVVIRYNKRAAELWGGSPVSGDANGLCCGSHRLYLPNGDFLPHDQILAEAMRSGTSFRNLEVQVEQPGGKRLWGVVSIDPVHDERGNIVGAINCFQDVTEHKLAQERNEAEERSRLLASIVESSNDAIAAKDLDGIITSWNAAAERIFGYSAAEVIGKSVTILMPEDRRDEEPGILERIRRGERIEHYETVRKRKNGSLLDISLTVSPIRNAEGKIIGASKIARDITERMRSEYLVATLAREAEHRTKNVFATVEATIHLTKADSTDELKRRILGRVRALSHVHGLFVKSRWAGADVGSILAQELGPYRQERDKRAILEGPHLLVNTASAQALAVIIHELATNAAKYGALSIAPGSVRVEWSEDEDHVRLRWSEVNGPEIEPPSKGGFGTIVMQRMVAAQDGTIVFDWNPQGLVCTVAIRM